MDKKDKIIKDAEKIKDAGSSDAQAFSLSLKANDANDVSTMKKYYSNDSKYSGDLDYYFEMLKSKIDKSLVEQFNNLKGISCN